MRHKKRRRVHFASRRLRISLAILLMATLLPLSAFLKAEKVQAATVASDTAFKNNGTVTNYVKTGTTTQVIPAAATFTVQVWFRADAIGNYNKILSQGTAYADSFYIDQVSNEIRVTQYSSGYSLNCGRFELNTWTHIAFVNERSVGSRCYVNGHLTASSVSQVPRSIAPQFAVGHFAPDLADSNYDWSGVIDEVRVYSTARTASNILTDMHTYGPTASTGLLAYYDFNDISGSTIVNKSTSTSKVSNSDLTINGSPTWEKIASETSAGSKKVVKFPRTFLTSDGGWTVPSGVTNIDALVVGGGGGGGYGNIAGGGGGGAVLEKIQHQVSPNSTYSVVVGTGGYRGYNAVEANWRPGMNGGDSKFDSFIAPGGGGGGGSTAATGKNGGSGGGGAATSSGGTSTKNSYSTWSSYGNSGGTGNNSVAGGGGGGAGEAGNTNLHGYGGDGIASSVSGSSVIYGGGGGGFCRYSGSGGTGGGGIGTTSSCAAGIIGGNGTNELGGGGGSGAFGGSGVVIISYATSATITSQPVGLTKSTGDTATFSVAATGNTLSYQWQLSTNNGSTWSDISGATSTSYTTASLTTSDHKKQYRVKVTSTINGSTTDVFSNSAVLRIPTPFLSYNASDTNSYDAGSGTPTLVKDLSGNNRNGTTTAGSGGATVGFNESTGSWTLAGSGSATPYIDIPDINSSGSGTNIASDGFTIDLEVNFGSIADNVFEMALAIGDDNSGGKDTLHVSRYGSNRDKIIIELYKAGSSVGFCHAPGIVANEMARWTISYSTTAGCKIWKNQTQLTQTFSGTTLLPASVNFINNFIGRYDLAGASPFEGAVRSLRLFEGDYSPTEISSFTYKTITYNSNNGSTISSASRYTSGQVRLPANNVTSRTNYAFSGWFSEAAASTKLGDASTLYTPTTSQTIYAGWSPDLCNSTTSEVSSGGKIYKVVKFGDVDTCIWQLPNGVTSFDTLVVGGGGGGGADAGSGGGGGGVFAGTLTPSATASRDLTITVGAGGVPFIHTPAIGQTSSAGSPSTLSILGADSFAITANGGGAGSWGSSGTPVNPGGAGGTSSVNDPSTLINVLGVAGTGGQGGDSVLINTAQSGQNGFSGASSAISGSSFTYGSGGGGGASINGGSDFAGGVGGTDSGGSGAGGSTTISLNNGYNYRASNLSTSGKINSGGGGGSGAAHGDTALLTINGVSGYSRNGSAGGSGVVYIRYEVPSFAVTLVENGGSTVTDTSFAMDGAVAQPANPTRDGYDFAGWSATDGGSVISNWPYSPGANEPISLYAKWTAKTFNVTFNSNGGSTVTGTTFLADGSIAAPTAPNKSGATFDGWATTANGTPVSFPYTPGVYSAITLYAKWKTVAATGKVCDGSFTENNLTASAGHGKVFYIDTGQGQEIDAGYVAYGIKSTSARNDLWVELSGFSGGVMSLADSSTSAMPLGSVTANGTGTAFFMLKATGATTTAQSHILRVYNQKPSIGNPAPLYECTFTFNRVEETIKAAANKVDSVASTSVTSIGSTMTVTVLGDSGTIGQGNDVDGRMFWLIPAARSSWPVNAIRLEKTELSMYSTQSARDNNGTAINTFTNTLRINNSTGLASNTRQYWKAVYTFRAIGVAATSAPIIPIAMISSGTQIKHTDVQALLAATNNQSLDLTNPEVKLAVTKNVSPTSEVRTDGTTRFSYSVNLVNSGNSDLIIDEVVDTPDAKASYVTGSAKYNNVAISDPGQVGATNSISFTGPLTVPAGATRTITYSMAIETCKAGQSYTLNNTATARSGVVVIGSGSATQSVVTVNGNCGQTETQVIVEDEPIPPDVTTSPASLITKNSATINGLIDPNSVSGRSLRFNYSTSPTLAGANAVNLTATTGSANSYAVTNNLTGLSPNTTYYYRLEVLVDGVWKLGEILSFTTLPEPAVPVADTTPVTSVSDDGTKATFNGTIDANQWVDGAKIKFEYQASSVCPAVSGSPTSTGFLQDESGTPSDAFATGSNPVAFNYSATGLTANTNYCVRIVGFYKGDGQSDWLTRAEGDWVSFTTTAKSPQNIVWTTNVQSVPAGTTNFSVDADADSSLAVTYTSVDPTICTVNPSTGTVTLIATSGNCVITATQSGNSSYYSAEPQSFSFAIIPPVITTTSLATGTYGSSYTQTINATDGNGSYDTWTITSGELPPGLTLNPNTGVISGTPTIAGIYPITVTTKSNGIVSAPQALSITINKVVLTVTASSHTLNYGSSVPAITALFNNVQFVSPDNVTTLSSGGNVLPTCITTYTSTTNANTSGLTTSCANGWASNYTFTYVNGSVTVNPLAVTITALNAAKKVGESDPANSYRLSPTLPSGQTISNVLTGGTVTYSRANGETPGEYVITPAGTNVASSNYTTTFVTGKLTITDKLTPILDIPSHTPITFGTDLTGQLNATGKNNGLPVSGTYVYTYVNNSGQTVTLSDSTKLPAGDHIITVTFTPTDGSTYHGPIQGSFTLTVNKFALKVRALKAAKQNLIRDTKTQVSSDPELKYIVGPKLPAGQTLSDVFPNGVEVARQNAGTPAGTYPTSNAAITGKEEAGIYAATPQAAVSTNYEVTFENDDFVITEKIVPTIETTDSSKTVNDAIGSSRLNANAKHLGNGIAGVFEYAYEDENGNDVVVTSATKLPLGVYTIKTKFTPSDLDTYYGPIYGVMVLTVNPYVAPTPDPVVEPTTPVFTPTPTPTVAISTPTASPTPTKRGGNNNAAPAPRQSPKPTPKPSSSPSPAPTKNGPYISTKPVLPGIGGLLNLPSASPSPTASKTATPSGTAKPTPSASQSTPTVAPVIPAKTTIDLGIGLQPLTTELAANANNSRGQGERSLSQLAEEKLVGFYPPGAGVRIEVLGARSGARFVLSDAAQVDAKALMTAMSRSIETQAADFFTIENLSTTPAPQMPTKWTPEEQAGLNEFFAGAGLANPLSLADVNYPEIKNWVGVEAKANTYVPGSTVYLTVTSTPLVIASAVVDENGEVEVSGSIPVEFLGAGEHRVRLVGTRTLDGVYVDNNGEVQVSPETLQEIQRFDLGTQATIGLIGNNAEGGVHAAMRVIPLEPTAPWWTIGLLAMIGLVLIGLRRRGTIATKQQRLIAIGVLVAATLPAVILGWLSTVTQIVWAGIAISVGFNVAAWLMKTKQKSGS